jgi:hypothetical protein
MITQPNGDSSVIWRKSSVSGGTGACLEVAKSGPFVLVRDSRNRSGAVLAFTSQQWLGLLQQIRNAAR